MLRNKWKWKHNNPKALGFSKSSAKKVHGYMFTSKLGQINDLTLHIKKLEKEVKNLRVRRKKEIVKIKAEINEKETKQIIVKISNDSLRS